MVAGTVSFRGSKGDKQIVSVVTPKAGE